MGKIIDDAALDALFREARTQNRWQAKPVSDAILQAVWELAKMPPTSANCSPMRLIFAKSSEAKARLAPALSAGNRDKTMQAPVTAIIGYDLEFYDKLPFLFPHADARPWFAGKPEVIQATAFRNGSLQGAYLMLAARAVGLDCGPMSGFDNAIVDAAFFPDGKVKSNFLCNIGYGDPAGVLPRSPRFAFNEVCKIV
ncbi:MAG: malonic semialdehyde reductase [Alphaproteobacteria bacterium]|nr:malonic semialdehyde reductase [Alphaproteobacteria bacterium]